MTKRYVLNAPARIKLAGGGVGFLKAGTEIRERKDGWFEISDIKAISLTPPTVDIKLITFTIDYHDRQKSLDLISE